MKRLNHYIDSHIIDACANKDLKNGYSFDVDSLSEHERSNFLDEIMKSDTSLRETILIGMQKMIDERLPEYEVKDRARKGLTLRQLSNGDTMLVPMRGCA